MLKVPSNLTVINVKMLMDPMGTIVMTSDGNAILREVYISYFFSIQD